MRTFTHPAVIYKQDAVKHKPVCKPIGQCPSCGRPVCPGCSSSKLGYVGYCLICSGMYKEENIILHPIPTR